MMDHKLIMTYRSCLRQALSSSRRVRSVASTAPSLLLLSGHFRCFMLGKTFLNL